MKLNQPSKRLKIAGRATLIDVIVVCGCLILLVGMLLPALAKPKPGGARIKCVSNQKQIGLAFRIFSNDNDDRYPFNVEGLRLYPVAEGEEPAADNPLIFKNPDTTAWHHFQVLSNELSSTKILTCPTDRSRDNNEAIDFLQNTNSFSAQNKRNLALSYFIGLEADETKPQSILAGDRHIAGPSETGPALDESQPAIALGVVQFGPNNSQGARRRWSNHPDNLIHDLQGNITLADGSVGQVSGQKLEAQLEFSRTSYGTNNWLFAFPNRD
ncbi:MAG: hypothetical protein ACI9VS_003511 [Candidatus Binatia bacterium]|jgi:hypothetical protein